MSSSTVRKNRQTARMEGTDKKTLAAQKEAAKQKKEKIKWSIVAGIIVVFFAFVAYLNTGAFYRNLNAVTVEYAASEDLGIKAGSRSFSAAECNYVYNTQFMNIYNSMGDYASMLIDTSSPLDEQPCAMSEEEGYTWDDYFTDQTKDFLTELAILEAYANANDIVLDKDDMQVVDDNLAQFDSATDYGYASADKFIAGNYGKGCNTKVVRNMVELQQLATKAQQSIADSFEFTASELSEKYASVKNDYDKFAYSFYMVAAEAETAEDGTQSAPTDEALNAAAATAQSIKDKMASDKLSLKDAAAAVVADAEATENTDVSGGSIEAEIKDWLVSADRAEGDCTVIKGASGAYVVVFTSRDDGKHTTEESGDMNYCDYVADNLLRNEALQDWHTANIAPVEEASSVDTAFGMRYVGR